MSTSIDIQLHTNQLSSAVKAEMWRIYSLCYCYNEEYFYESFDKNTHYAIYRKGNKLVGFTGLCLKTKEDESSSILKRRERYFTIYYGQTIITNEVSSCSIFRKTGTLLLKKCWRTILTHRIIFWADALSYRAYLVFAKNLCSYYPNAKENLPKAVLQLRNRLGKKHYADRFCTNTGTVRKGGYLITDPKVEITPDLLSDSDALYYAQTNPMYKDDYGLLTIGPAYWKTILYEFVKVFIKKQKSKLAFQFSRLSMNIVTNWNSSSFLAE